MCWEAFLRNKIKYFTFAFFILSALFQSTVHGKEKHMSGPAQNGVLIYSGDLSNLSEFYEKLFGMRVVRKTNDFISLETNGFNLIIHVPPFDIPTKAFSSIKLFLTVDDMAMSRGEAVKLGGQAFEGEWSNPIFKVSNIADRDGNHIQLRQFNK
jgi:predicted enzyme related to lactoylglutathione lyase